MSYTNHKKAVNDALNDLIKGEFSNIPVDNIRQEDYKPDYRNGECIRFFCINAPFIGYNTSGETREYIFEIDYYFDERRIRKTKNEDLFMAREEQMKQLLQENVTYQPSGTYKWHNGRIEDIEYLQVEEKETEFIRMTYHVERFNQNA